MGGAGEELQPPGSATAPGAAWPHACAPASPLRSRKDGAGQGLHRRQAQDPSREGTRAGSSGLQAGREGAPEQEGGKEGRGEY